MSPKGWATPEEAELLHSFLPDFLRRQAEGKLHLFWAMMQLKYFTRFPEQAALNYPLPDDPAAPMLTDEQKTKLGDAIKSKQKKLNNWYRYQGKKVNRTDAGVPRAANAALRAMFRMDRSRRRRAHQPIEIFQKRNPELVKAALTAAGYYELTDGLGVEMDSGSEDGEAQGELEVGIESGGEGGEKGGELEAEMQSGSEGGELQSGGKVVEPKSLKGRRMEMRSAVVKALWESASEEDRVFAEAEVLNEAKRRGKTWMEEAVDDQGQWYRRLDTVYSDVHKATYNASGWVGMTIMGGPNPRMKGDLSMKIICFGQTPAGNDFEDSCVDFDINVAEPFEGFLRQVFTAAERQARALPLRAPPTVEPRVSRLEPLNTVAAEAPKSKKPKQKKKKAGPSVPFVQEVSSASAPDNSSGGDVLSSDGSSGLMPPTATAPSSPQSPTASLFDEVGGPTFDVFDNSLLTMSPPLSSVMSSTLEETATQPPWPPGMSALLSPNTAQTWARMERGGVPDGGAIMAIDPHLENLMIAPGISPSLRRSSVSRSSSPSPLEAAPQPPQPRTMYFGAAGADTADDAATVPTTSVGGFNFPRTNTYPPSTLFQAFTPTRAPAKSMGPRVATGVSPRMGSSQQDVTWAAQLMNAFITRGGPASTPLGSSVPPPLFPQSRAAAPQPIFPQSRAATQPAPFVFPQSRAAPASIFTTPASIFAPPQSIFAAPQPALQPVLPLLSTTPGKGVAAPARAPAPAMPGSRPAAKPPVAKAPPKGRGVAVATGEGAAPAPKKRGRPTKAAVATPLADTTNADVVTTNAEPVGLTFSITNNTRRGAQRAAAAEEAKKKKAAAEEEERQLARGWVTTTQKGHECLILLNPPRASRERRPTTFHDGTVAQRETKGRKNANADLEAALVARAGDGGAGMKRKASAATSAPKPKKYVFFFFFGVSTLSSTYRRRT
ncbi:hypothetical protein DFH07DRAFT_957069 [Mycena maculata]|uniref:Uncharacterized protein n=1 Tax=Mycena maculata TaxID=230809 RepID=A0AAD7JF23_9AGAR|nr:hypothetical protein DFH07DRAFT_957069 [Mycena maculata]